MVNHAGHGRDDEENVAKEGDSDRNADRLEATPSCVGEVSAKQGNHVHPKRRACENRVRVACKEKTHQKLLKVPIPVDARWPRPRAPGCLTEAPVFEPFGSGCWIKLVCVVAALVSRDDGTLMGDTYEDDGGTVVGKAFTKLDKSDD